MYSETKKLAWLFVGRYWLLVTGFLFLVTSNQQQVTSNKKVHPDIPTPPL